MIQINRVKQEPVIVESATTVKEAVEYAARKRISLEGAELSGADLSGADLSEADLSWSDLSGAEVSGVN